MKLDKIFHLKENHTDVKTEAVSYTHLLPYRFCSDI